MNMAYCTLLSSEDYLDAVLVLYQSLQAVKAQYPLFVIVTEQVANNRNILLILNSAGILYDVVKTLSYSDQTKQGNENGTVLNTASKIQIFTMKQWDKLVYLDADILILKNLDHLFKYPDGAMLKYHDDENGFTALFVIEPAQHSKKELEYYYSLLQHMECFDGDLLGNLWFMVRHDKNYQISPNHLSYFINRELDDNIYAVHYCNVEKPWLNRNSERFSVPTTTNLLYHKYLSQVDKIKNF